MTPPGSPGTPVRKQLGKATPTCDRCGEPTGPIQILGEPDPDFPDDLAQIVFRLPAKHHCRRPAAGGIDLREARTTAAGAP